MISQLHSPVAAIIQKEKKQWVELVNKIAEIEAREDKGALDMGDTLLEVEDTYGKDLVRNAVKDAGVSWSKARQRMSVAKRIPKGHSLRETHLSFCHLRALVSTGEKMDFWAEETLKNDWSVEALEDHIKMAGDELAQESGVLCIQCENPIKSKESMISFNRYGARRARLCGPKCAIDYFKELLEEDTP